MTQSYYGLRLRSTVGGAALLLLTGMVLGQAPAPPAEPGAPKPPEAQQNQPKPRQYTAQVMAVRADANRITFRATQGGSQRTFNMMLADGAQVQNNGQPVGLGAIRPESSVRITTELRNGLEQVVAITAGEAPAQQAQQPAPGQEGQPAPPAEKPPEAAPTGGKLTLAFPTGDPASSVLLLETNAPDEVRVGEAFDYQVKVTNVSKNLTLENIVVRQTASARLDLSAEAGNANAAAGQPSAQSAQRENDGDRGTKWTVPALPPGESVTFSSVVAAHEAGTVGSCFRVSYEPALCVRIRAVEPQILLTKAAPEAVRLCEPFGFKYTVQNTGTAPTKRLVITDQLPEGLVTADGKQTVTFEVGELPPGQTREFDAPLTAAGRGQFTSKATAKTDDGLSVESRQTTTVVREADLEVTLVGPESQYVEQPVTFLATVKNDGDAPAPESVLQIQLDPKARFVQSGKVVGAPDPKEAAPDKDGKLTYALGTVNPGETRKVSFTVSTNQQGALEMVAVTQYDCARAKDDAAVAMTRANVQTQMLVIPALRISLVDQQDLIKINETVTYTLKVDNQGTGPDQNLTLRVTLPEGLEFISVDGPTPGQAEGQVVTLGVVKELPAGQNLTWNIKAKAIREGDVRTTAEMTSAYLTTPVTTTEPTRLVK